MQIILVAILMTCYPLFVTAEQHPEIGGTEVRDKEPSAHKEPSADREPSAHKEPSASAQPVMVNSIVIITDVGFVPISQFFDLDLNQLPPSSAGLGRSTTTPQ